MAEKINDGGPAFPVPETQWNRFMPGMTLREYYAGEAMKGILASEAHPEACGDRHAEAFALNAKWAVQQADALLAELAKEEA